MKKAQVIPLPLEVAQAPLLAWALLFAELAAAAMLIGAGRMPLLLVRSLQLFLRF